MIKKVPKKTYQKFVIIAKEKDTGLAIVQTEEEYKIKTQEMLKIKDLKHFLMMKIKRLLNKINQSGANMIIKILIRLP